MLPNKQYSVVGLRRTGAERDPAGTLDRVLDAIDQLQPRPGDVITIRVDRRNPDYKWDDTGNRLWRGEDEEARIDSLFGGKAERDRREHRGDI